MKKHFIRLFLIISYFGFSQCEDVNKLEFGGSLESITNNYIPFEIKHKDSVYQDDIAYPFDIKLIEKYTDLIFKKSSDYIIKRGGKDFYQKLSFDHLEVNYLDTTKITYENHKLYDLSKHRVTYWILYTYTNNNIKYGFGLEFDKNGKMISENKFPKYSENKNFENLNNYCEALEVVKKDKGFKNNKIDHIELAYLDNVNSFCWLIEEQERPSKKLGEWKEKKVNQYYINSNTYKLEKIAEKKFLSISCGFKIKKKSKKK